MRRRNAIRLFVALTVAPVAMILLSGGGDSSVPARAAADVAPNDSVSLDAGRRLFHTYCWFCHGTGGRGDGPVARFLPVQPSDFTLARQKIRSTPHGALPTDQDLYFTIGRGGPGTHMPGWHTLSERERWQLAAFIKTFSDRFRTEGAAPVVTASGPPHGNDTVIGRGKQLFDEAKCWLCHGKEGRGDGAIATALVGQWGLPHQARNLQDGDSFKGGSTTEDVFRTITTGFNGTPMGAHTDMLTEQDRWRVAHYVARLAGRNLPRNKPLETGVSWQRGRWVFFGKGRCINCHKVERKANATRGPDLSRIGLVGATRRNGQTAIQYIYESITDPSLFQPLDYPNAMPQINREAIFLESDEIRSLVVYLSSQGKGARPDPDQLAALPDPPPPDREANVLPHLAGDPVHGWELFNSEQATCSKCHALCGLGETIGPDLTNLSTFQSPGQVGKSLLEPNNVITYGFQQVTVVMTTGQLAEGVVVEQDSREVRLADGQGRVRVISREQIEEMAAQQLSTMPGNVAEPLSEQDQSDLIACLLDQYPALESALEIPRPSRFVNPFSRAKNGPPLDNVAYKVGRSWLADWLKDPLGHDPNAFMPNLELSEEEIEAIIAYLSAIAEPVIPRRQWSVDWAKPFEKLSDEEFEAVDRRLDEGKRLWSESRCSICHRVGDRGGLVGHAPALTRAAAKLRADWVFYWLRDPRYYYPSTQMPHFRFTPEQRANLAVYLLRGVDFGAMDVQRRPDSEPRPEPPAELPRRGREVITRSRCVTCHDIPGIEEALPKPAPWPEPSNDFERLVRDARCLVCHSIGTGPPASPKPLVAGGVGRGGPRWSTSHGGNFAPDLTTVGSRLRRDWIERFLVAPDVIRPLLKQMPKLQLTSAEARTVADYAMRNLTDPRIDPSFLADYRPTTEDVVRGRQIYYTKGCNACHQIGLNGGVVGPTLTTVADRLEPGYILEYMKDPQRFIPDVVEPNYGLSNSEAMELTKFLLSLLVEKKASVIETVEDSEPGP